MVDNSQGLRFASGGKFFRYLPLFVAVFITLNAGCAAGVMDAMNNAHKAIESARAAQAERYAPVTMAIATANYELARDHFIKKHNRLAKNLAMDAIEAAGRAEIEAREAAAAEENQRRRAFETQERRREQIRAIEENEDVKTRRYLALAHRRVLTAALAKAGAHPPQGVVEIEVWIAPNGKITQLLIVKGDPDALLSRIVIRGLQELQLEPFPKGVNQNYLKLRVTIDTRVQ